MLIRVTTDQVNTEGLITAFHSIEGVNDTSYELTEPQTPFNFNLGVLNQHGVAVEAGSTPNVVQTWYIR